jgi:hypothetical protein
VLAQRELLKEVLESGVSYSRIVCLSGLDYPIWSNKRIREEFTANYNKEYIVGMNISRPISDKRQLKRIVKYHFLRDIRLKNKSLKKFFSATARIVMTPIPLRKKAFVEINNTLGSVYFGSDWWALTYNCAKYVYEQMCVETKIMKYFKWSYVPSEMCVQTIIFNSSFGNCAMEYKSDVYKGLASLTPLHYIEYTNAIKIFNETDYQTLLRSGKMFFRKASSGYSDTLLDSIDKYRLNN